MSKNDDPISRQDTINALDKINCFGYIEASWDTVCDIIESVPPSQKQGQWEFYEDRAPVWDIAGVKTWARAYKCSECGFIHTVIEDFGIYLYCPNCGAEMKMKKSQ